MSQDRADGLDTLALAVLMPGFEGTTVRAEEAALVAEGLGGVCLFGSNLPFDTYVAQLTAIAPRLVIATDEEGGDVTRLHYRSGSPALSAAALGVVNDLALTEATNAGIGTALAEAGITLDFSPIADVNTNPLNPVIGVRSFGSDVAAVSTHVAAAVRGLQGAGVGACTKHYPGHGDTHDDSHLSLPVVAQMPDPAPFAAAIEAGVAAIMTSHIVVTSVDPDRPATLSPTVLGRLRDELGYRGVIVSDALDMAGASAVRGIPRAAVEALIAGCDLLCIGPDKTATVVREVQAAIVAAVATGHLLRERLEEAAGRVAHLRTPRAGTVTPLDECAQVTAAGHAIRVEGVIPDLTGAITVRVETEPSPAIGTVPWALPSQSIDPATFSYDHPIVVQARDAHRHPSIIALLSRLPQAVVVELGWPGPWPFTDGTGVSGVSGFAVPRIVTFGASRPALSAVADLLSTKGWRA